MLQAALYLLGARQDGMLSVEEWADLARAVAACQGRTAAEYLTDRDLDDLGGRHAAGCDHAAADAPASPTD